MIGLKRTRIATQAGKLFDAVAGRAQCSEAIGTIHAETLPANVRTVGSRALHAQILWHWRGQ